MPIDDDDAEQQAQKPAGSVARFQNMPKSTVPNSGATKKLKSACT